MPNLAKKTNFYLPATKIQVATHINVDKAGALSHGTNEMHW